MISLPNNFKIHNYNRSIRHFDSVCRRDLNITIVVLVVGLVKN